MLFSLSPLSQAAPPRQSIHGIEVAVAWVKFAGSARLTRFPVVTNVRRNFQTCRPSYRPEIPVRHDHLSEQPV